MPVVVSQNIVNGVDQNTAKRLHTIVDDLKWRGKIDNQTDLAAKMGYSPQHVSKIINGKAAASTNFCVKLCKMFPSYSLQWIRLGVGNMRKWV